MINYIFINYSIYLPYSLTYYLTMMNLSEYQLLNMLNAKVGGESSIAIMIANDALELGKTVFNIKKNIKECQKEIDENNYDIDNMTIKQAKKYLICSCGRCIFPNEDEMEEDEMEEAMEEAIDRAHHELKRNKEDIFYMMKDYETIMGEPYNIDYITDNLVKNVIKQVLNNYNNYNEIKEMFNNNEEQEKDVIVKTIKKLLNECENGTTKINKFEIITCMMCVIANSPIFMNIHVNFKNTVLVKLEELSSQISDINYDKTEYYHYIEKIKKY